MVEVGLRERENAKGTFGTSLLSMYRWSSIRTDCTDRAVADESNTLDFDVIPQASRQ